MFKLAIFELTNPISAIWGAVIKEFSSAPASGGVFMSRLGFDDIVFQTDIAEFQIFSILHIGFLFLVLEKHAIPIFND